MTNPTRQEQQAQYEADCERLPGAAWEQWERRQIRKGPNAEWKTCGRTPTWKPTVEYRRKPD